MLNATLWRQFEGQWVDHTFRLKHLIGTGGFGGVFLAEHFVETTFIRQVAIKLVLPNPENAEAQLRELVNAATLHHDNLLSCFHAGSSLIANTKLLFLVMELADESLEAHLKTGVLHGSEAVALAKQVASALAYLHDKSEYTAM